jgi:hypothetical protein
MSCQEGAGAVSAVFLRHDLEHGDHVQFAQRQFPLALRRDLRPLLRGNLSLAEDGREAQRIAVGTQWREAQRRDDDQAVLFGEAAQQPVRDVEVSAFVRTGAVQEQHHGERLPAVPGRGYVEAVGDALAGRREHVFALLVSDGRPCRQCLGEARRGKREPHHAEEGAERRDPASDSNNRHRTP